MWKRSLLSLALLIAVAVGVQARGKVQGIAVYSQSSTIAGLDSTNKFTRVLASATITVYTPTGTANLATLYSTATGTAKSNPFTAGADGSYHFYTDVSSIDIRVSGVTGVPPFTISDVRVVSGQSIFDVRAFGATCNGSTNDRTAIQNALTAASSGGIISLPPATCYLGTAAQGTILTVTSDNIKIRGAGMGRSVITYSSASRTGTFGSGSAIFVGNQFISHVADGFEISDLTITDTNTTALYGGAGPGGVTVYNCDDVRIERLALNNIKAGAAIIYVGELSGSKVVSKNLIIRDNIITGTSGGSWVEGDGINAGNVNNARIERNRITGVLRHGIEGGNFRDAWLERNQVDMQNQGLSGFATIYGARISVSDNDVRQWADGQAAIALAQDANTYPIQQVTISNNRLLNSITVISAGTPALRFQPVAGTAANLMGPIVFNGNIVQSVTPIEIYLATTFDIYGNTFEKLENTGAVLNNNTGANPAIGASDVISIHDNYVTAGTIAKWPDANWKVMRLKLRNNKIGQTLANAATDAIDGNLDITFNPGPITAVAMSSATQTSTFIGALVGDEVRVTTDTALPVGCYVVAQVTSGDTITWRVLNGSGADQTIGSTVFRFWIVRR